MKILTIFLVLITFSLNTATASSTPAVEIESNKIFSTAEYHAASETFEFTTKKNISVVQVYDMNGEVVFHLPVMSSHLKLKKNLFGSGEYKLGFVLEGESTVSFTKVNIK